jgi:hypothetical protein
VDRVWFTVTEAQTGRFRYFFDRGRVRRLAEIFLGNQFYDFSPFELVLCLLADEASDTFWQRRREIDYQTAFATLPFSQLTSLLSESTHWQAERALFQESDIATREICMAGGESLAVNCPPEIADLLQESIERAKPMLTAQFENILKPFKAFRESVPGISRRIDQAAEQAGLRSFAAEVIAKLGKEMISPGP